MKIVNWNVEWATSSWRTDEIRNRINRYSPEIVCLTETHSDFRLLLDEHQIFARPNYGSRVQKSRRKVLLWSREPWERLDDLGDRQLPPGRFVLGVTRTTVGEVTVVGLCIPWRDSRTGAGYSGDRRQPWDDHEDYLEHLDGVLARVPSQRLVVMGDFNQAIGKAHQSGSKTAHRADLLRRAIRRHVTLVTSDLDYRGRQTFDHIGLSSDLTAGSVDAISNIHTKGELSDHFGVVADVSVRGAGNC